MYSFKVCKKLNPCFLAYNFQKLNLFPAEGRTFLRTVGAQRASARPSVRTSKKKAVFKWLQIEKYNEIERVCVP